MARRTKAQVRAEKIAAIEARRREEDALLRELKREAAREEKAAFDAALFDLGKWLASEVSADSVEKVAALREALSSPEDLDSLRSLIGAPGSSSHKRRARKGRAPHAQAGARGGCIGWLAAI